MLNESKRRERKEQAQDQLYTLRERGFRYLTTNDDGATWNGCQSGGIEIGLLLGGGFIGHIVIPDSA